MLSLKTLSTKSLHDDKPDEPCSSKERSASQELLEKVAVLPCVITVLFASFRCPSETGPQRSVDRVISLHARVPLRDQAYCIKQYLMLVAESKRNRRTECKLPSWLRELYDLIPDTYVLSVGLHVVVAVAFITFAVGTGLAAFFFDAICDTTSVRQ